jgi:hypothetical protein
LLHAAFANRHGIAGVSRRPQRNAAHGNEGCSYVSCATLFVTAIFGAALPAYWLPVPQDTFQWDLEAPVPLNSLATVYDVDDFDNPKEFITALHRYGKLAICYIDARSFDYWLIAQAHARRLSIGQKRPIRRRSW